MFLSVDPIVAKTNEPYHYADQDPIDRYDPDGTSCKWAGVFGHWAKQECHKIAAPAVTIRDEFKAQVVAVDSSVVSTAIGAGPVKPKGPVSGAANSPSPIQRNGVHAASCLMGWTGLMLWGVGATIEGFETKAASLEGSAIGRSVLSQVVGRLHTWPGTLMIIGSAGTGGCGLWG